MSDVMSVGYPDDPLPGPRMPPRCDACKHWTTGPWISDGYGQCDAVTYGSGDRAQIEIHGMCDTLFSTRPDFFCALHDPKPKP